MNGKKIYAIDVVLIVGTLFALILLIGYARPLVVAPVDDGNSSDSLFEFKSVDEIFIGKSLELDDAGRIHLSDGLVIRLKAGVYYWKISEGDVREVTILDEMELKFVDLGDRYGVMSDGVVVDVYKSGVKR